VRAAPRQGEEGGLDMQEQSSMEHPEELMFFDVENGTARVGVAEVLTAADGLEQKGFVGCRAEILGVTRG
jgi:hypothetical protein